MLGRRTFGVAGAAILGSLALLASGVAHAAADLDAEDKSKASVTFAKELLKDSTTHEEVAYYSVTSAGTGLVKAKLGLVIGANRNATVEFIFQNLVFINETTPPALKVTDSAGADVSQTNVVHSLGGFKGASTALFTLSPASELPADTVLTLDVSSGGVGISASEPVSVTMEVRADPVQDGGVPQQYQVSHPNAIDAKLAVTVTENPINPVASVNDGYLRYKDGPFVDSGGGWPVRMRASLGTVTVSVEPYLKPDGVAAVEDDIYEDGGYTTDGLYGSSYILKGDFSFPSFVTLENPPHTYPADPLCTVYEDNLIRERPGQRQELGEQQELWTDVLRDLTGRHLCIWVNDFTRHHSSDRRLPSLRTGSIPMPETAPYQAEITFDYKDGVNQDFAPAMITVTYGSIRRDGAQVRLPYMVTDPRYNQRLFLVNHGEATTYEISFSSEEGVTARPGMRSSGTLPSGTTVLRVRDVVTIEGGPPHRVSGTITFPVTADNITVATNQTNRRDGETNTVVYKTRVGD